MEEVLVMSLNRTSVVLKEVLDEAISPREKSLNRTSVVLKEQAGLQGRIPTPRFESD